MWWFAYEHRKLAESDRIGVFKTIRTVFRRLFCSRTAGKTLGLLRKRLTEVEEETEYGILRERAYELCKR